MEKTSTLRGIAVVSLLLALVSCAPQAFVIRPEMRTASKSGLNLAGKTMGVVYLTSGNESADSFNASLAEGFAARLEEDYFGGHEEIGLFKMPYVKGDYSAKDTLIHLVMESGKDVIFLFDRPELGEPIVGQPLKVSGKARRSPDSAYVSNVAVTFGTKVYVYDSMNKEDKVLAYNGNKSLSTDVYSDGSSTKESISKRSLAAIPDVAYKAGGLAANSFLSGWKQDSFLVVYYDGAESAWNKGAEAAYSFKWDKAITEWLTLTKSKNAEKRACAAYNIALGCFMSGLPDLALEWLDRSDKDMPVSLSKDLRRKIKEYTGR
jgi:hypothetical protein